MIVTHGAYGLTLERVDGSRNANDAQLVDLITYQDGLRAEAHPEDPPLPLEQRRALWRETADCADIWWLGRAGDGRVVAAGEVTNS